MVNIDQPELDLNWVAQLCIKRAKMRPCFKHDYLLLQWNKCGNMKHELILIADKIESIKCKTHTKAAKIKIVRGNIKISCCCDEHKRFLERQAEYEIYKLFNKEDEQKEEVLSQLKYAV